MPITRKNPPLGSGTFTCKAGEKKKDNSPDLEIEFMAEDGRKLTGAFWFKTTEGRNGQRHHLSGSISDPNDFAPRGPRQQSKPAADPKPPLGATSNQID